MREGRYEQELNELDAFFEKTGHPRAPRFYIMKWLSDYITEFGIDGYRCDTVKHTEEYVWQEFKAVCESAFAEYKNANPEKVLDENEFYLVGEIYNYGISSGKMFDFGDKKVNYFDDMFTSQINFEFKWNAKQMNINDLHEKYDALLHNELKDFGILNYLSSHDDGSPFDPNRNQPFETATKLLLSPGASQVYYGDEIARSLVIEGTVGDATLRSPIDWSNLNNEVLAHWQKLEQFRNNHPAVGAGEHTTLANVPYVFSRSYKKGDYQDAIVVAMDLPKKEYEINVSSVFTDGDEVLDFYSGQTYIVEKGMVKIDAGNNLVLLEKK